MAEEKRRPNPEVPLRFHQMRDAENSTFNHRTVAEWVKQVAEELREHHRWDSMYEGVIEQALDTYARQRVEAFRERAAGKALEFDAPGRVYSSRLTAKQIAAAIQALEP